MGHGGFPTSRSLFIYSPVSPFLCSPPKQKYSPSPCFSVFHWKPPSLISTHVYVILSSFLISQDIKKMFNFEMLLSKSFTAMMEVTFTLLLCSLLCPLPDWPSGWGQERKKWTKEKWKEKSWSSHTVRALSLLSDCHGPRTTNMK
jgi:hypothetical protein